MSRIIISIVILAVMTAGCLYSVKAVGDFSDEMIGKIVKEKYTALSRLLRIRTRKNAPPRQNSSVTIGRILWTGRYL